MMAKDPDVRSYSANRRYVYLFYAGDYFGRDALKKESLNTAFLVFAEGLSCRVGARVSKAWTEGLDNTYA